MGTAQAVPFLRRVRLGAGRDVSPGAHRPAERHGAARRGWACRSGREPGLSPSPELEGQRGAEPLPTLGGLGASPAPRQLPAGRSLDHGGTPSRSRPNENGTPEAVSVPGSFGHIGRVPKRDKVAETCSAGGPCAPTQRLPPVCRPTPTVGLGLRRVYGLGRAARRRILRWLHDVVNTPAPRRCFRWAAWGERAKDPGARSHRKPTLWISPSDLVDGFGTGAARAHGAENKAHRGHRPPESQDAPVPLWQSTGRGRPGCHIGIPACQKSSRLGAAGRCLGAGNPHRSQTTTTPEGRRGLLCLPGSVFRVARLAGRRRGGKGASERLGPDPAEAPTASGSDSPTPRVPSGPCPPCRVSAPA